jgi:very-short-patch-repair endonuclease
MAAQKTSPDVLKVENKLKYWSRQLHDLSGRNRLLFYRDTKSSTATIESPEFLKLFETVVDRGGELLAPLPVFDGKSSWREQAELNLQALDTDDLEMAGVNLEELDRDSIEGEIVAEEPAIPHSDAADEAELDRPSSQGGRKPKKNEILTNRSVPALNRVMYNLRYLSRTVQEEQGFNVLYITFGMLKWKEVHTSQFSLAPLVLVPVHIDRQNPNSPYKIRMAEEDIVLNPVLQIKLAKDFGFQLPEIGNDISAVQLQEFLQAARQEIERFSGWEVVERATLGAFNFVTLLLIKDFENYSPLYCKHPIVRVLSGVETESIPMPVELPQARELDDLVDPSNVYQVLDADSSQQEAIEAAKRGLSFVLQGPPGTGKSQTIANIIVESMMAGKKVLFVSQKMAALEVVQNRLNLRGLKEFCLEIHSHKMDKRKVIHDLMDSLSNTQLPVRNPHYHVQQRELKRIRDDLNNYVRQLHQPRFELGLSLYQAHGRLAQCLDAPQLNFSLSDLEHLSPETLGQMQVLVREIANYPEIISNHRDSRWKDYSSQESSLQQREGSALKFAAAAAAIKRLSDQTSRLAAAYHIQRPETLQDCLDYAEVFASFRPSVFSPALRAPIDRYIEEQQSIARYLNPLYREDVSSLKAAYRKGMLLNRKEISHTLELVRRIADRGRLRIVAGPARYERAADDLGSLEADRALVLEGFALARGLFPEDGGPEPLRKSFGRPAAQAADWLADWSSHTDELAEWANFNAVRKECNESGLEDFVNQALGRELPPEKWEQAFARRFYVLLIEKILTGQPLLQKFKGATQSDLIRRFRELDLALIENSSHEIRTKLHKNKPLWSWMEAGSAATSILRRESNKKRRLVPLRKLFLEIPSLLQALKPCFMMSPLTVCQLLDPSVFQFDVAVFDEASQIPPEYAMGAFLRARQVIVAGDSQQLPPTNFFQNLEGDDGQEEESAEGGSSFESILDVCDSSGFPNKMLNWHYRSRDESLIAYSNYHFYDNRLCTFPNPSLDNPATGLKFVYVDDGIYKSGSGARYNRREAGRVAELVHDHLLHTPELSLGIVTFSAPQRRAVEMEIERLRTENPGLNSLFSYDAEEPIFIKNLENVQGDERDVIILSVGYGRDEAGRMALNFGPINRDGGARRLNVAVTRARYLLKLVSSIQPEDIDLRRATSRGAWLLRNYLEAARDGIKAVYQEEKRQANGQFESLFEESVRNELAQRGVQVVPQVGVSQYRIDLAVMDPDRPGQFLLGIECDGPMYYSAMTARDRDRLRQQVLEGLGWRIHRIWSRDWIQNREGEVRKILHAIDSQKMKLAGGAAHDMNRTGPAPQNKALSGKVEPLLEDGRTPPGAVPYRRRQLEKPEVVGRQAFLDAPLSQIIDMFQIIANADGPISVNIARALVLDTWETRRGKKIDERLDSAILRGREQKAFLLNGTFLWPLGRRVAPLRVHAPGEPLRPMDEIAPEEIESAVRECVRAAVTIGRDDLVRETCKLFGLKATHENALQVDDLVESMLEQDQLKLENDKLSAGRNL